MKAQWHENEETKEGFGRRFTAKEAPAVAAAVK